MTNSQALFTAAFPSLAEVLLYTPHPGPAKDVVEDSLFEGASPEDDYVEDSCISSSEHHPQSAAAVFPVPSKNAAPTAASPTSAVSDDSGRGNVVVERRAGVKRRWEGEDAVTICTGGMKKEEGPSDLAAAVMAVWSWMDKRQKV
mmetsp:Transcript_2899/g.7583  ORF Transcript_2899/g.7583 Transcript_2899/m.7583 type:complete len:145 (-) Transcript_2899:208-642(-)|eukprot:CAMPEP_0174901512 /NCGR_PEP_ID=MMETSP0167-20121228/34781_1 /TAXON_ID=38298 /ORGANISM="Rhodella maculata, Strain CCMP736" /LENGTH=144 /DNA_ID=CAMNT_0016143201 /DNA_START=167 /DNA_END=601 /DNA_ORIENTATION=-